MERALRVVQEGSSQRHLHGMQRLVRAIKDLSLARSLDDIVQIVRTAARELVEADGASFVLLEEDQCHYVDEDAIEPTWKGKRFPSSICIGGWAMRNRGPAVIEDVYQDERIPIEAYRPTYIRSLVMVPVRTEQPIAAIGTYWAHPHAPTTQEVELIQALADSTSVAFANIQAYEALEQRVQERTAQLQMAVQELEAFSYAASHDLRTPVANISSLVELVLEDAVLTDDQKQLMYTIQSCCTAMDQLIHDLLQLSRITRSEMVRQSVNLSALAEDILAELRRQEPGRQIRIQVEPDLLAYADPNLLRVALTNLLHNAWKYTGKTVAAAITVARGERNGVPCYWVRDNGAGFDMQKAGKLFQPFMRLHSEQEFFGTGVGLATVARIIHRHGGEIWAEATPGQGATFFFTLPDSA